MKAIQCAVSDCVHIQTSKHALFFLPSLQGQSYISIFFLYQSLLLNGMQLILWALLSAEMTAWLPHTCFYPVETELCPPKTDWLHEWTQRCEQGHHFFLQHLVSAKTLVLPQWIQVTMSSVGTLQGDFTWQYMEHMGLMHYLEWKGYFKFY